MFATKRFWAIFLPFALSAVILGVAFDVVVVDGHSCENPNPSLRLANGEVLLGISSYLSGVEVGDFAYAYHDGMDVLKRVGGVKAGQVLLEGTNPVQNLQENPGWVPVGQVRGKIIAKLFTISRTATVDQPDAAARERTYDEKLVLSRGEGGVLYRKGGDLFLDDGKSSRVLYRGMSYAVWASDGTERIVFGDGNQTYLAQVSAGEVVCPKELNLAGYPSSLVGDKLVMGDLLATGYGVYAIAGDRPRLLRVERDKLMYALSPNGVSDMYIGFDESLYVRLEEGGAPLKVAEFVARAEWVNSTKLLYYKQDLTTGGEVYTVQ